MALNYKRQPTKAVESQHLRFKAPTINTITAIYNSDFVSGTLNRNSYLKANRVFTANEKNNCL